MRWLFWLVLVSLAGWAQGRFDLPAGHWGHQPLQVTIQAPSMRWDWKEQVVSGSYQVTAVKADFHVTFQVQSIQVAGHPCQSTQIEGLGLKTGDRVRLNLKYDDSGLELTAFDPQLVPVWHHHLEKE